MFKEILTSLSDTELVAISMQVSNKEIKTESIMSQLSSKSNTNIIFSGDLDELRQTLTNEILFEFSTRIFE